MLPRTRLRAPLWTAFAVAAAVFVVRSVARGFDFTPDLPMDAILLVILIVAVALVAWVRADDARRDRDEVPDDTESEPEKD